MTFGTTVFAKGLDDANDDNWYQRYYQLGKKDHHGLLEDQLTLEECIEAAKRFKSSGMVQQGCRAGPC